MCLNFVMYYPKMNLVTCVSDEIVTQPVFSTKYAKPVFADWYVDLNLNLLIAMLVGF